MASTRSKAMGSIYQAIKAKGFKSTQALVILARKLARIVFALLKGQSEYQSKAG